MNVEIRISGFRELDRALATLPNAVSRRVLKGAIKKSLKPVLADAKPKVPVDSGELERSLAISSKLAESQKADSTAKPGDAVMYMGSTQPDGGHDLLVEFGTVSHVAQPYTRPAWDSNKVQVVKTIGDETWKSLQRLAKRLFKQAKAGKLSKVGKRSLFG